MQTASRKAQRYRARQPWSASSCIPGPSHAPSQTAPPYPRSGHTSGTKSAWPALPKQNRQRGCALVGALHHWNPDGPGCITKPRRAAAAAPLRHGASCALRMFMVKAASKAKPALRHRASHLRAEQGRCMLLARSPEPIFLDL